MSKKRKPLSYIKLEAQPDRGESVDCDNYLSDIAELETMMEAGDDLDYHPLFTNLRISPHTETLNELDYEIGVKKAWLVVDPSGYKVRQNNRYGEVNCPIVSAEIKEIATRSQKFGAQANVEINPTAPNLNIGVDGETEAVLTAEKTYQTQISSVTPQTGNRWEILPTEGRRIVTGLVLGATPLCRLQRKNDANNFTVTIGLLIKKTDFSFSPVVKIKKFSFAKDTTDEKLLAIFTGKVMLQKSKRASELNHSDKFILASQSVIGGES